MPNFVRSNMEPDLAKRAASSPTQGRQGPGPSRPIWVGKCQKQKVSSAGLVGKSLVRPVGVLWTTLGPPIGHMEQKSKNPTIITIIIYIPIQPFKGSLSKRCMCGAGVDLDHCAHLQTFSQQPQPLAALLARSSSILERTKFGMCCWAWLVGGHSAEEAASTQSWLQDGRPL